MSSRRWSHAPLNPGRRRGNTVRPDARRLSPCKTSYSLVGDGRGRHVASCAGTVGEPVDRRVHLHMEVERVRGCTLPQGLSRYNWEISQNFVLFLQITEKASDTERLKLVYHALIHAADDLASFLRYPLIQLCMRGESDATDQADGARTSATGTDLQNDRGPTPPRAVPGSLDGTSGAAAPDDCPRWMRTSYDDMILD
jgi:hypothetical protein